jgi:hypothetical protein
MGTSDIFATQICSIVKAACFSLSERPVLRCWSAVCRCILNGRVVFTHSDWMWQRCTTDAMLTGLELSDVGFTCAPAFSTHHILLLFTGSGTIIPETMICMAMTGTTRASHGSATRACAKSPRYHLCMTYMIYTKEHMYWTPSGDPTQLKLTAL